jgi:hypothetical protein
MVMTLKRELQIEDLRNHPEEMVLTLRSLLAGGAKVNPDPKRPDFFEVESGSLVYYIHVSPATGKILLLATWPKEAALEGADEAA